MINIKIENNKPKISFGGDKISANDIVIILSFLNTGEMTDIFYNLLKEKLNEKQFKKIEQKFKETLLSDIINSQKANAQKIYNKYRTAYTFGK